MADTPTFQSNPYGSFDPSQWLNPYSQYYGKALPWPSSYAGTPNNAMGQPIAAPQGMTLNSTPAQPQAPAAAAGWGASAPGASQINPSGNAALLAANWGGFPASGINTSTPGGYLQALMANPVNQGLNGSQAAAGGATAGAGASAPNNWQQTLSMLANPGKVTTPGATVPQAAPGSSQPSPGVLQNFLANWKPASSGAGSGFTQNFNTILRGLQGS
jgi:hypothetical protein